MSKANLFVKKMLVDVYPLATTAAKRSANEEAS
jgi:hypothetical protein